MRVDESDTYFDEFARVCYEDDLFTGELEFKGENGELLELTDLPNEDEHDFRTAAGMVVAHFGRIPNPGEHFNWNGFRFEVVDLDGARIDKLLIGRVES